MIVDNHAHIWPRMGGEKEEEEWDYESVDEHMKYLQRHFFTWGSPGPFCARRVKDDSSAKDACKTLLNKKLPGTYRRDINFRFEEETERYVWEANDEEYYIPASSPAPPDLIIPLMDKVGVDKAVLQHTTNTYKLNRYYLRAMHKYPDRFIPLTLIDWSKAYTHKVTEELRMDIEVLGLKGLQYEPSPPRWDGYGNFHMSKYDPLWSVVRSLGIPVYASFCEWDYPILKIRKWVERFPEIPRVFLHGFPRHILFEDENTVEIRDICVDIVKNHNSYLELLPRTHISGAKGDEMIRCLYETFGPSKLVWGSELGYTATESKYSKVLGYFEEKCDYMSKDDLKLILGGNIQGIFKSGK